MTAICGMALGKRPIPVENSAAPETTTANFLLPNGQGTSSASNVAGDGIDMTCKRPPMVNNPHQNLFSIFFSYLFIFFTFHLIFINIISLTTLISSLFYSFFFFSLLFFLFWLFFWYKYNFNLVLVPLTIFSLHSTLTICTKN